MTTQNKITTLFTLALLSLGCIVSQAQQKTDTLILNVGKSRIVFLINDHADLKSMQDYDLNRILDQLSVKLTGDSTLLRPDGTAVEDTTVIVNRQKIDNKEVIAQDAETSKRRKPRAFSTYHSVNFDIGTNNYVNDGKFPDETNELYTVKPFGSWYVGITSTYKTYLTGPLYLEWGVGVSWYNFKFENTTTRLLDTPDGVTFFEAVDPTISYEKSKLTVAYVNASFVPMLDFSDNRHRDNKFWPDLWNNHDKRGLRLGFGGYIGYKIDSYTKVVIDNGDDKKQRNHDNYHLENLRYGARVQMGFRGTDIFFNYDLNELFAEDKGPKLNAFSFGIIL